MEDELEKIIDKNGMKVVLISLGNVCAGKAEHLRTNWQDESTAKIWEAMANGFEKVASDTPIDL